MQSNRDWDTENEVAKQEMEPDENKWSKACILTEGAIENDQIVQRIYY